MNPKNQKPLNKTPGASYWSRLLEFPSDEIADLFRGEEVRKVSAKELFRKFVCIVNIETATKCNRKCSYCPDAKFDRTVQKYIDPTDFERVLRSLAEIDYKSTISLNLYNEPLLDRGLLEKIKQVRQWLPDCFIKFNSNGDYLSDAIVEELSAAGLNAIFVTLHCSPGTPYVDEDRLRKYSMFFKRVGKEAPIEINPGISMRSEIYHKGMRLLIMADNWSVYGNDRSGLIPELSISERNSPCVRPFREFTIAWDGHVYPCCQFFPDSPTSVAHRVGNIHDESIFSIYASSLMTEYRKNLFGFERKLPPCNTCRDLDNSETSTAEIREMVLKSAF